MDNWLPITCVEYDDGWLVFSIFGLVMPEGQA